MLAGLVEGLVWYTPTDDDLHRYGDGGVAIIDQWIASHAKLFIGIELRAECNKEICLLAYMFGDMDSMPQ